MKKLIIDGHNLIPKIPGLNLKDMDDELRLMELLQQYCRLARRQAELFFDGSPDPQVSSRKNGLVHVHFVRVGSSADDAILHYVNDQTGDRKNLTVVSSDHRVRNGALASGVEVINSEVFSRQVFSALREETTAQKNSEKRLSDDEVEEWMRFFNDSKNT